MRSHSKVGGQRLRILQNYVTPYRETAAERQGAGRLQTRGGLGWRLEGGGCLVGLMLQPGFDFSPLE